MSSAYRAEAVPSLVAGWLMLAGVVLAPACVMPGQPPAGPSPEVLKLCGAQGLIDDCEDNNNQCKVVAGRGGYWYTFADNRGTTVEPEGNGAPFVMTPGGVHQSKYAARAHGRVAFGENVFGGMGVNLVDPKSMYDASHYKGIAFWAKKAPDSNDQVRFGIPDAATDPAGEMCTDCYNDFGIDIIVSESWQHYVFTWRAFKQQPDWGMPRPRAIKSNRIFALQWQCRQPGASYDLWVDDIEFVGCD